MKRQLISWLVLFVGFCPFVWGQNLQADLKKMQDAYSSTNDLSLTMGLTITTEGSQIRQKAIMKKHNQLFYYEYSGQKMVTLEHVILFVNDEDKNITVSEIEKRPSSSMGQIAVFDSLISNYEEVRFLGTQENEKRYFLRLKDSDIREVYFNINSQTNLLTKVRYVYDEKRIGQKYQVDIVFTKHQIITNDPVLNLNSYVRKMGDTYIAQGNYLSYKIFYVSPKEQQKLIKNIQR